ncbi:MAG: MBOAT family O-acyltransferase [Christensenellales bacterium]
MVFSSNIFLFFYLPCVLLMYYAVPRRFHNLVLFIVNLVFYGWGEPLYLGIMLLAILLNYAGGYLIDRNRISPKKTKRILVYTIVLNLLILGFFKYASFFVETLQAMLPFMKDVAVPDIPLPIGISFYIFQTMSYTIDVYRKDTAMQKNIISFGTYVALFPQLIAGPIVRYKDVAEQIDHRKETVSQFANGVMLFIVGLAKKVLIANQMGQLWELLQGDGGAVASWVGIIAYAFQIYFDFSGYSDMARGLGNMFGFEFLINFNYPYISKSITEFWRRWHMSLSEWFRDYVYIPLGGNRQGIARQILNIAIVWSLTGLWHGANWNFVLWGAYFAILLIVEKLFLLKTLEKTPPFVRHIYALFFIVLGWVLFYFEDMGAMGAFVGSLFAGSALSVQAGNIIWEYLPLLIVAAFASTPLARKLYEQACDRSIVRYGGIVVMGCLLVICVASLVSQSYNPFIYFRF